ncbi:LysM peptidoglycan-binding domain-containing protein, partial [Yersinia enterocolitica]|nr:LysM peptidoglycan-binding domain-containing protein [Yersinia enterocolitica]
KLKSFNSGYKRNVTAPTGHGPRYIMLPKAHAEQLKDSLADTDIAAVQPTKLAQNSTKSASNSQYKVRPGDTLSTIAKRLNIKTSDLQSWNNLSTKSTLKVGQTLQLASNTTSSNSITYQVRKGDSFASIAKRHGVNTDDVMRWNSVVSKANKLLPGLKLTLFVNGKSTPDA